MAIDTRPASDRNEQGRVRQALTARGVERRIRQDFGPSSLQRTRKPFDSTAVKHSVACGLAELSQRALVS